MSKIEKRLDELNKILSEDNIAQEGYRYFRSKTPVKSGNARRKTVLRKNEVQADYPYARRLDEGYSRQAPDGMTQPTIQHIQDWIRKQSKG